MRLLLKSILVFLICSFSVYAEEFIAVLELEGTITKNESAVLTDKLINQLANTNKYRVVERSQMQAILQEQEFQQTGCTSSECAVDVGQILGVEKIVTGSIGKIGSLYSISLRMINVSTGEIERSSSVEQSGTIEDVLTKGIRNSVNVLSGITPAIEIKPTKESSSKSQYESQRKTKRVFTIVTASCAAISAGLSVYFYTDLDKKKTSYDQLTTGADFESAWADVESAKTATIATGGVATCFAITSVIIGTRKIETPKGNDVSFIPSGGINNVGLTLNFNF